MRSSIFTLIAVMALLAAMLVPVSAYADSTRTLIIIENETAVELAGNVQVKSTGQGGKLPGHTATPYTFRDTAYFTVPTTYPYKIMISDKKGGKAEIALLVVNSWLLGPEVVKCQMEGMAADLPGMAVTAVARQDALGSCRCEVRIRPE